jgi:hypothetical protein
VRRRRPALALASIALFAAAGGRAAVEQEPQPRFVAVDVFVDAGEHTLAGWQLDVTFGSATLVGVEGGEPAAFRAAPTYDSRALRGGRVVLAALAREATAQLPNGRVRTARLHVMTREPGLPAHELRSAVAVDVRGNRIEVDVEVRRTENK